ncbi:MAG: rRNA maturation RNase YbeY [Burkholderiales bacterium]|nr:rRNA maturation RNase YbeY [Burkholderiales bacterium]
MATIAVQRASRLPGIPSASRLRAWAAAALPAGACATVRVVNGAEARRLNRGYRGRDYATNVLTFAYGGTPPAADIVLCAPVLAREARAQGKTLAAHYAHLTIHGALHAAGMDHDTPRDAAAMEALETRILGTLGFADPYEDRAAPPRGRGAPAAPAHGRTAARPRPTEPA